MQEMFNLGAKRLEIWRGGENDLAAIIHIFQRGIDRFAMPRHLLRHLIVMQHSFFADDVQSTPIVRPEPGVVEVGLGAIGKFEMEKRVVGDGRLQAAVADEG